MSREAGGSTARLCGLLGLWLVAALPAAAAPRAGPPECRAGETRSDVIEAVDPRGEIAFASGTRAVLGSLRWPDGPAAADAQAWLSALRGQAVTVVVRGEADRWGRVRIDATTQDDAGDLAGGLIGAGLAQADAGEIDTLCRPGLLAVEDGARRASLGLWRSPPIDAADGPALRAAAGRFAVVQGVARHVGERSARTYLDFVRRGDDGLTVTVSKRTWRRLRERGLSAEALRGRIVRVRGVVEVRRGPVLDATSPEAIEVVEAAPRAAAGEADRERAPRR